MRKMKDSGIEWIGEIPEGWDIKRGKHILTILERPVLDNDEVITCFRDGEVTLRSNRREEGYTFSLQEIGYQGIEHGDLVVHGMDGFAGAIGISDSRGKGTPVLNVMDSVQNKRYLMYYLRCAAYCGLFLSLATGIRVRSCDTNWNKLKSVLYLLPSIRVQNRIAAYLDVKTAAIDDAIAKEQTLIDKLAVYKQSLITETVTKGLTPDATMKDSGVEWIGAIPAHWTVSNIARIATVVRGASPRPAGDPRFFNGNDVPWITVAEVTNSDGNYVNQTETYLTHEGAKRSRIVPANTLLLSNSGATLGVSKITKIQGCINDGSVAFYNLTVNQLFLLYVFRALTFELRKQMQGYGQPNLNTTIIKGISIAIPSSIEQQQIADYLDAKCAAIDANIAKRRTMIEKLTQYKKSLIYEAVTGKMEI